MERDEVDVGVGSMGAGPWGCPACHYVDEEEVRVLGFAQAIADSGGQVIEVVKRAPGQPEATTIVGCQTCGVGAAWRSTPAGWSCLGCGAIVDAIPRDRWKVPRLSETEGEGDW